MVCVWRLNDLREEDLCFYDRLGPRANQEVHDASSSRIARHQRSFPLKPLVLHLVIH